MDQKLPTRFVPAAVVVCLGLLMTLLVCVLWQRYYYHARVRAGFEERALSLSHVLQTELENLLEALETLGALYTTGAAVKREEFQKFARIEAREHPAIQALAWIPRVRDAQRAAFEASAQAEGFVDFQLTEQTPAGQLVRAGPRLEYFPIYVAEPPAGTTVALGFDLASQPTWRTALEQARETG